MLTREPTLKEAMDFLELNAYEGSNAITTLRMGDIEEILKPIRKLVNEHFNPQPYKFEELKKGMWVWYKPFKECKKIRELSDNDEKFKWVEFEDGFVIEYEDCQLFPLANAYKYQRKEDEND